MTEIRLELQEWCSKDECTKRELLSIQGKLCFMAKVVNSGHIFVRRIINAAKKARNLHSKIHLKAEMKKDFRWWLKCLGSHNGVKWFPDMISESNSTLVFTDASDTAAAAVVDAKWTILYFDGRYSWVKEKSINYREMLAVVLAVSTFGRYLKNKSVLMDIDNKGMQQAVQSGKSKEKEIMALIRCIYFYTSTNNVQYRTVFIEGKTNVLEDRLSRGQLKEFRMLAPLSEISMTAPADMLLNF